ncbi:hypothetical protein Dda_5629 [Drechslerella dactyloides]|uniref:Uncharacterized protein n=1 Tax=Drechslerella dactyloides TaxID=74499 RepID=A0AAD6IWF6_DREDA|nr:hypothetical protein Dda_5629 [Drechslerella dactyloides]
MVLCHAHAQLDDSFDEEFDVANYNLAQVAEFEAARRHHHHSHHHKITVPSAAAPLTQSHVSHLSSDPMQIDTIVASAAVASSSAAAASLAPSRKLKRSCDCDAAYEHADASGSKRVKQVAF